MSRNPHKGMPAGIWSLAILLLNVVVIRFAYTSNALWYGALAFTAPLLWWALVEAARERKQGES